MFLPSAASASSSGQDPSPAQSTYKLGREGKQVGQVKELSKDRGHVDLPAQDASRRTRRGPLVRRGECGEKRRSRGTGRCKEQPRSPCAREREREKDGGSVRA